MGRSVTPAGPSFCRCGRVCIIAPPQGLSQAGVPVNSPDRKFLDLFLVVIGLLMLFALGLFGLSRFLVTEIQHDWIAEDERVRATIESRIAPIGRVVTEAEAGTDEARAQAASPSPAAQEADPALTAMTGPQVYQAACTACHANGVGGAPVTGDGEAWAARIEQGTETLYEHAIEGYMGDAGYMPAKGGRADLSDAEVRAAVDYMVEQVEEAS